MAQASDIKPGALFTHYKDKDYEIITMAQDEATTLPVVVYRALYGEYGVWVRKLESFCENVAVDGVIKERFALKKTV